MQGILALEEDSDH